MDMLVMRNLKGWFFGLLSPLWLVSQKSLDCFFDSPQQGGLPPRVKAKTRKYQVPTEQKVWYNDWNVCGFVEQVCVYANDLTGKL